MPVLFSQTHTIAGHPTSFTVGRVRINDFITDGFMTDSGMPDGLLTMDDLSTISRELVDILRGWILNGFTPNYPLRNFLRHHIYGFINRRDLNYVRDYLQRELSPLEGVFKIEFSILNWVSEEDGLYKMDLRVDIALTDDIAARMLMY